MQCCLYIVLTDNAVCFDVRNWSWHVDALTGGGYIVAKRRREVSRHGYENDFKGKMNRLCGDMAGHS